MKQNFLLATAFAACAATALHAETVNVPTAGTLPSLISAEQKYSITDLTLTGEINGTDLVLLREMMGLDIENNATEGQLASLDLSGVTFKAGGDAYLADYSKDIEYYITEDANVPSQSFSNLTKLTSVVLPASATQIKDSAFYKCSALADVTFPEALTHIGTYAFEGTSLTSVTLPAGCLSYGKGAFRRISTLTSATLPDALTEIPASMFADSGITGFNWPASCTKVCDDAFYSTELTELVIPEGVTELGSDAFGSCRSLESVSFPTTLQTIGDYAFEFCYGLTNVVVPDNVQTIGESAFYFCQGLETAQLPSTLPEISNSLFGNCFSLTTVNSPAGVTRIGDQAFNNTCITEFAIPSTVTSIGMSAFEFSQLSGDVVLPETLTELGENAFAYTYITSCNLPSSLTSIPDGCFSSCYGITEVVVPEGVTTVGMMAFMECGAKSITLPSTLTYVGSRAFSFCYECTSVTSYAETPAEVEIAFRQQMAFNDMAENCVLYVPQGCKAAYEASEPWNVFSAIEEFVPTGLTSLQPAASASAAARYNLFGQPSQSLRGFGIQNGRLQYVK